MYGVITLQLWETRLLGIEAWFEAMAHATITNPPLLVWAGQFLVPLRPFRGDIESTLLFVNVLAAGGTLTLIYLTSRRLGAGLTAALAAVLICAGSQIFIELTDQYLLEAVQCCAAAAMVFAAWDADKRSLIRTFALLLIATAFSFLTKTSSGTFVLPLLAYAIISSIITRRRARLTIRAADVALLIAAATVTAAALIWYVGNWQTLIQHFVSATFSEGTLYWGSPVHFPTKIAYWTQSLTNALSPFLLVAICLCVVVVAALLTAIVNSYDRKVTASAEALVENGGLFALALTGTIVATLCAFSLQINDDRRFLLPLIPLISVLVAWSLAVIGRPVIVVFIFTLLTANAVVTRAYAHGRNPFYLVPKYWGLTPYPWLLPVQPEPRNKVLLTAAVQRTCRRETGSQPIFVATEYAELNVNSANFYSEKERGITGLRCSYVNYGSFQTDVGEALSVINRIAPAYVLTVSPDKQPPADNVNVATRPVAEHLAHDPQYELVSEVGDYILIYRRVRAAN
jgi:4-amino-4-deoxy-L-arabinose transferase-like glycosyltransferase